MSVMAIYVLPVFVLVKRRLYKTTRLSGRIEAFVQLNR